jgi:hypothetical protein
MPEVLIILFSLYADEINPNHVSVDRIDFLRSDRERRIRTLVAKRLLNRSNSL